MMHIKDIKQIQEYNRRKIIKLCSPEFDPERFEYPAYQIGLSKVLLASEKIDCGSFFISNKSITFITSGDDYGKTHSIDWNLTKQTLEEQEESVQRTIWKLLRGK